MLSSVICESSYVEELVRARHKSYLRGIATSASEVEMSWRVRGLPYTSKLLVTCPQLSSVRGTRPVPLEDLLPVFNPSLRRGLAVKNLPCFMSSSNGVQENPGESKLVSIVSSPYAQDHVDVLY